MAKKKSFVMLDTWGALFEALPDEQAGILIKAIYSHERGAAYTISDPILSSVFNMIRETLEENAKKYQEQCDRIETINKKKSESNEVVTTLSKSSRHLKSRNEVVGDNDNDNEYEDDSDHEDEDDSVPSGKKDLARTVPPERHELDADVEPLPLNTGEEWKPTANQYGEYCRLYPGVDVAVEFRNMRAWCLSNPTKRKTRSGITRFVNSWLSKSQNSGKNRASPEKFNVTDYLTRRAGL